MRLDVSYMRTLVGSIGTVCNLMEEVQSEALLFSFSLFRHCVFGVCQIGSEAEDLCSFRHLDLFDRSTYWISFRHSNLYEILREVHSCSD